MDKNEKYVYEESDIEEPKEKPIIRTWDASQKERFTIEQLERDIAEMEGQKISLDLEIAKIQEKIDEATAALISE